MAVRSIAALVLWIGFDMLHIDDGGNDTTGTFFSLNLPISSSYGPHLYSRM